jgi:hypothetical protein
MSANETAVTTETAKPKTPKTMAITLTANGTTMRIRARRKRDGTAETFVTTTDAAKKTERGMTETHPSFEAATASIAASATKAEKLGWTRKVVGRVFVAKPDAFSTLPAPPKKTKAA